jgi:hypothetical protein
LRALMGVQAMKQSVARTATVAALVATAAVVVGCPDREPIARRGLPWSTADMEFEMKFRAARTRARFLLAREVAAGRRDLYEAAALLGAVDRRPPAAPRVTDDCVPEPEALCRDMVFWVDLLLLLQPTEKAATVARLETELSRALAAPGGLRLPEVTDEQVDKLLAQAGTGVPGQSGSEP